MTFWSTSTGQFGTSDTSSSTEHDTSAETSPSGPAAPKAPLTRVAGHQMNEHTSGSTVKNILIISAILAPFAAAPYLLMRRTLAVHTASLSKQLNDLRTTNAALAREVRASALESGKGAEFRERVLGQLKEQGKRLGEVNKGLENHGKTIAEIKVDRKLSDAPVLLESLEVQTRKMASDAEAGRSVLTGVYKYLQRNMDMLRVFREETKVTLSELAYENKRPRDEGKLGVDELKALAESLADIAAFIEEVEMREGWTPLKHDQRGIAKMRILAQRLEQLALDTAVPTTKGSNSP